MDYLDAPRADVSVLIVTIATVLYQSTIAWKSLKSVTKSICLYELFPVTQKKMHENSIKHG
jgi:hypothetical protein